MIVDSLISLFDIALDHDAFDQSPDVVGAGAAVEHFLYDADLLLELLVGIVVVGVYDAGGILQIPGAVKLKELPEVLVVVVGQRHASLVDRAAKDGVGQVVSRGLDVPVAVDEGVAVLGRIDGIQHDGQVAAGGVLHAGGHVDAAGHQAVLLVLHRAGADGDVGKEVHHIAEVFRIEHLVGGGQAGFLDGPDVHVAQGDDACQRIRLLLRVWLVHDALVAVSCGARLIRINARDDQDLVLDLLLHGNQAAHIVADGFLVVCGAGTDDGQKFIGFPGKYLSDFFIAFFFYLSHTGRHRVKLAGLLGRGQLLNKIKCHFFILLLADVCLP